MLTQTAEDGENDAFAHRSDHFATNVSRCEATLLETNADRRHLYDVIQGTIMIRAFFLATAMSSIALAASAQDNIDGIKDEPFISPFPDFENAPPGVEGPFTEFPEREVEIVRPFGDQIEDVRGNQFAPLNEFAGQKRPTDPGILGDVLGRIRSEIASSFSHLNDRDNR